MGAFVFERIDPHLGKKENHCNVFFISQMRRLDALSTTQKNSVSLIIMLVYYKSNGERGCSMS